ncbi:shikimate kinase [Parasporobacterium paucivorans DSM 15970]|uniref:Shikimate kinase n=2 Tax=Parasporobacterium TaxID=115543 RepID=A0A1M6DQE3_9FIRM|nr:shikimate kinase [Parasporobacterium paucivorans]SHI75373.1 shikimate kinase [Parasporobacterium paucivorans DSM 15970]
MNNIVLIGMPGVGKSTVGVILAKVLGFRFIDADLLIQEEYDRLLCEIIEQDGVDAFIQIENQVNSSIQAEKSVIATGGSVVYGKEAMEHLKSIGTVVYLKLDYEPLSNRLKNIENRGVVIRNGSSLHDLFVERTPLYEKYADIIIDTDDCDIEGTVHKIAAAIQQERNG